MSMAKYLAFSSSFWPSPESIIILKIPLEHPLTYRQLLSLSGSISQRLRKTASTVLGPGVKCKVDVHAGRAVETPEIWFNLAKEYYIFLKKTS